MFPVGYRMFSWGAGSESFVFVPVEPQSRPLQELQARPAGLIRGPNTSYVMPDNN